MEVGVRATCKLRGDGDSKESDVGMLDGKPT